MSFTILDFIIGGFQKALSPIYKQLIELRKIIMSSVVQLEQLNLSTQELIGVIGAEREQVQDAIGTLSFQVTELLARVNELQSQTNVDDELAAKIAEQTQLVNEAIVQVKGIYEPTPVE